MRFIPLLLLLAACAGNSGPLPASQLNQFRTYFNTNVQKFDSTITVDSFRFVRMDTLNNKHKYLYLVNKKLEDYDKLNSEVKEYREKAENSIQMMRLANGVSSVLYQNSSEDFKRYQKAGLEKALEAKQLTNEADSLLKIASNSDSSKPIGFQNVFIYQIRMKDQSIKRDTAWIYTNIDKNIMSVEDLYKP